MCDVVIVGSGPAGVAAALGFTENGIRPSILDVGILKDQDIDEVSENFYQYRKQQDSFSLTIGEDFWGLYNLINRNKPLPVKLAAPRMAFVTKGSNTLSPVIENNFRAIQSFASGGLANAWGAGLYRYTDAELQQIAISQKELIPYYDKLTKEIGISGQADDLSPYFGSANYLQKPLKLSFNAEKLLRNYYKKRHLLNTQGIYLGRPRLGVLSEPMQQRDPCDYNNLEFWQPGLSYIYNPVFTLNRLVAENKVDYRRNLLVKSWTQGDKGIEVNTVHIKDNKYVRFYCKYLVLAAGAINTAKIVLETRRDYQTQLQLLDNPAVQIPLIFPFNIGKRLDVNAFGLTQLNIIWDTSPFHKPLQGSILELTSPLRSEFFSSLPLSASVNIHLLRLLLPAMMVMQLFFPSSQQSCANFSLGKDGTLLIQGPSKVVDYILASRKIFKYLRMMGAYSHPALSVKVPLGNAIHYGGTLPVSNTSGEYTCDTFGQLNGTDNIFIVDGSLFPILPAKNYSFTMMANAMRISYYISKMIRNQLK
jgi:choline dehydrogenase-like flavoprotein